MILILFSMISLCRSVLGMSIMGLWRRRSYNLRKRKGLKMIGIGIYGMGLSRREIGVSRSCIVRILILIWMLIMILVRCGKSVKFF